MYRSSGKIISGKFFLLLYAAKLKYYPIGVGLKIVHGWRRSRNALFF